MTGAKTFRFLSEEDDISVLSSLAEAMKFDLYFEKVFLSSLKKVINTPNIRFSKNLEEEKLKYFKNGIEVGS